ncbi:MAG TPA: hypothetical protein VIX81_02415 [Gammaproteobacteria bacterium]
MGLSDETVDRISAIFGIALVGIFVLGLAWSISHGFAGFWGGLPFWVIALIVLALIVYDFWSTLIGKKKK